MNKSPEKYISDLLYQHECVVVPDFGGFVARYMAAELDQKNNRILPPFKTVSFNKNLINNDGLLLNHIMNSERFSYEKAQQAVKKIISEWNFVLNTKNRLELNGLGVFVLNSDNTILFEPRMETNYLIDSFGLFPVSALELPQERSAKIIDLQSVKQQEKTKLPVNTTKYLKIAATAIAIPVIAFGILQSLKTAKFSNLGLASFNLKSEAVSYVNKSYSKQTFIFPSNPRLASTKSDPDGYTTFAIKPDKQLVFKNITTVFAEKSENLNTSIENQYQVVIGCFSMEENAQNLVESTARENIMAYIAGKNKKGLFVVSAGSSANELEAQRLLKTIKAHFPSAWVMKKKA